MKRNNISSVLLVLLLYINISTRYCINRNPRIDRLCQIRIEVFYCSGVVFVKTYISQADVAVMAGRAHSAVKAKPR